jgi:hypothetical protein
VIEDVKVALLIPQSQKQTVRCLSAPANFQAPVAKLSFVWSFFIEKSSNFENFSTWFMGFASVETARRNPPLSDKIVVSSSDRLVVTQAV